MTIDALGQKSERKRIRRRALSDDSIAIGEQDSQIFDCPSCARPLASGTSRCPGCGARLIAGVLAKRALAFIVTGWLLGAMIGIGVTAGLMVLGGARIAAAPADVPVVLPTTAPATGAPVGPDPAADPAAPITAYSALRQTAILNARLATGAERMATAIAAKDTIEIARVLRALSADAAFGDRIAPGVSAWTDASVVASDLAAFYSGVGEIAREGLAASLTNRDAYRVAGRDMMKMLDRLPGIDAASRELAASVDLDLPPVFVTTP